MEVKDNVIPFRTARNPDDVLEQALGVYQNVVVIGWDHDGGLDARASTNTTRENILWLIETFKRDQLFRLPAGE